MKRSDIAAAALTMALASGAAAQEASGFLTLEGGLGLNFAPRVGMVTGAFHPAETDSSQLRWLDGTPRGPLSLNGRAEAGLDVTLPSGRILRLGGILNAYEVDRSISTPLYSLVVWLAPIPSEDRPRGEIAICTWPDPCAHLDGSVSRSYVEIMPQVFIGPEPANGQGWWFGAQPFWGRFDEESTTALDYQGSDYNTTLSDTRAEVGGLLLAARRDIPLSDSRTLQISGGLGPYWLTAEGETTTLRNGRSAADEVSMQGMRAQLGVRTDTALNDQASWGLFARADYWSDQPYMTMETSYTHGGGFCTPTLCEPPRAVGLFDFRSEPTTVLTVGASLTYHW